LREFDDLPLLALGPLGFLCERPTPTGVLDGQHSDRHDQKNECGHHEYCLEIMQYIQPFPI